MMMARHSIRLRTRAWLWARNWGLPILIGMAFAILGWALLLPVWAQLLLSAAAGLAWFAVELAADPWKRAVAFDLLGRLRAAVRR